MSWTQATWPADNKLGGLTIQSATITGDTTGTSYEVGKGKFRVVLTWTTCAVDGNDELYVTVIEANTRYATSTYYELQPIAVQGAYEATGRESDTVSTGSIEAIIDNPYDYQIRVRTYCNGSSVSSANTVVVYPLSTKY